LIPFSGLGDFKGKVIHAHDYQTFEGFENKNVFIVGIGNSALDIAVELARVAKMVALLDCV
jgi:cation diffusion facilitator CzcD-associated flavoprotein CzcO